MKDKWLCLGRWVQPTISESFWQWWAGEEFLKHMGFSGVSGENLKFDGYHCFLNSDFKILAEASKKAVREKNREFFDKFSKWCEKTAEETFKAVEKVNNHEKHDIIDITQFFVDSFRKIITPWTAVFPISMAVEELVKKKAEEEGLSMDQIAALVKIPKPTLITKQKQDAREIINSIKKLGDIKGKTTNEIIKLLKSKDPKTHSRLKEHVAEFEWVGTHHFVGEPLTEERVLQEIDKPEPAEHKPAGIKISEELKRLIELSGRFAFDRLYMAELSDVLAYSAEPLFEKINKKLGLKEKEYIWLTFTEILNCLKNNAEVPSDIEERKKALGTMIFNGKEKVIVGEELMKLVDEFVPKKETNVDVIKGMVASRGKAKGKVRLVIAPEDAYGFKKGEILVAPETTPDFVPAMEKAAAIVTDRGGLTSHAAVVARELGVPCVIGTDIGTKALKNGDVVEVDAEKGVVRKLDKA